MDVQAILERYQALIAAELQTSIRSGPAELAPFYDMMRYHLGWLDSSFRPTAADPGKRLRPTLCLLTCEAAGGEVERAVPAAAALELMHNFSLIHDDIEDQSEERRHRPTVWKNWGVAQAINTGDGMYILASLALQRLSQRGVPADVVLATVRVFDETCLELCQGQYLDLSFETRNDVTVALYLEMIRGKSAALFSACTHIGALLASPDPALVAAYCRFGLNLGLAFQIVDDILGIWGDPALTGKSVASDVMSKKKTLPLLYALEQEKRVGGTDIFEIYRQDRISESQARRVVELLDRAKARAYCQATADSYLKEALRELDRTGRDNQAQQEIREISRFLVERAY